MPLEHKKVFVAMSGGVDSSVAAVLLSREGHTIVGATMCLGITDEQGSATCCGPAAVRDARRVCDMLGVPHYVLNFSATLHTDVITNFIEQYAAGKTPNPCVRCNQLLKFTALYNHARTLGYDAIATGHYARVGSWNNQTVLMRHHDSKKDQTYFLYSIPLEVLSHVLFPLDGLVKNEVRTIAHEANLSVAAKAESQEICFVPDNNYRNFLKQHGVADAPGKIVDTSGKVLGSHTGIFNYTIGQRKGLGIAAGSPLYVVSLDAATNMVVLGEKKDLLSTKLTARTLNLFVEDLPPRCTAKVRYAQTDIDCQPELIDGVLHVTFPEPVEAVTPGQSVVLYLGDVVLGGGIIEQAFR